MLLSPDTHIYEALITIGKTHEGQLLLSWLKESRRKAIRNPKVDDAAMRLGADMVLSEIEEEFEKCEERYHTLIRSAQ